MPYVNAISAPSGFEAGAYAVEFFAEANHDAAQTRDRQAKQLNEIIDSHVHRHDELFLHALKDRVAETALVPTFIQEVPDSFFYRWFGRWHQPTTTGEPAPVKRPA